MNTAHLIKKMNAALLINNGLRLTPTINFSGKRPHHLSNYFRSFNEGQTNSNQSVKPTVEDTQKSFSKLPRHFAAFHSFLVSSLMRTEISPAENKVFINYRGEQVGDFVSHICNELERYGIKYFIDKNEQRGKDLQHLYVRIQESTIALVIFSTRYSESSWCMNELVEINKLADQGKLTVIPIFYKVRAEDVTTPRQDSEFGRNFWKLAEDSTGEELKNWKEALKSITKKMGLSFGDERSESEADFIKKIVKELY